jgi:hypothetical protein
MRLKVIVNKDGRISAAISQTRPIPDEDDQLRPRMGPVLENGQTLVELGVPDEYASYPVEQLFERIAPEVQLRLGKGGGKQK